MTTAEFQDLKQLFESISTELGDLKGLKSDVEKLSTDVEKLGTDVEKFNERFANYQQATQWVVQLAFSLIASATVIVIITNVLNK